MLYRVLSSEKGRALAQVKPTVLYQLPIIDLNTLDFSFINKFDQLILLITELKFNITTTKTPAERTALERQIQNTDTQIDQLVYQLYGLTEDEIKIVEGGS